MEQIAAVDGYFLTVYPLIAFGNVFFDVSNARLDLQFSLAKPHGPDAFKMIFQRSWLRSGGQKEVVLQPIAGSTKSHADPWQEFIGVQYAIGVESALPSLWVFS